MLEDERNFHRGFRKRDTSIRALWSELRLKLGHYKRGGVFSLDDL